MLLQSPWMQFLTFQDETDGGLEVIWAVLGNHVQATIAEQDGATYYGIEVQVDNGDGTYGATIFEQKPEGQLVGNVMDLHVYNLAYPQLYRARGYVADYDYAANPEGGGGP